MHDALDHDNFRGKLKSDRPTMGARLSGWELFIVKSCKELSANEVMHEPDPMSDRNSSMSGGIVSFGPFHLSSAERLLKRDGRPIRLGGRALDLLIALVGRAGEVVGQRELISCIWPDVTVEDANLRVHLAALRKALGDGREGARYIVNVPGRGYSFVASTIHSIQQHPIAVGRGHRLPSAS